MRYAKPATTFEEQADLLLKRGMIGDRATLIARLSFVNYYRLSAYWWPFRKPGPTAFERLDEFIEGAEFTTVWDHYAFDQRLRVLVMEAIERIEVATRTQLAYHHAHAWTPDAYATNPTSLPRLVSGPATDPRTHAAFLEKLHVNLQQNGDKPFVRHFKTKYTASAHLPIWMAVELMSLGNVTSMYQGCTDDVRDLVARPVGGVSNAIFGSWLLTLLNVRNICAHHDRLWNRKLAKIPAIPAYKTRPEWYQLHFDSTKLYAALTICNGCGSFGTERIGSNLDRLRRGSRLLEHVASGGTEAPQRSFSTRNAAPTKAPLLVVADSTITSCRIDAFAAG